MILELPFDVRRELTSNSFSIDFFEGELRQCTERRPFVYKGPGTIAQLADGTLQIRLMHTYASPREWADEGNLMTGHFWGDAGQIIDSSGYFAFSGKAEDGTEWMSERVSVSPGFGLGQIGRTVVGQARQVFTTRRVSDDDPRLVAGFRLVCPGKYYLHWADDDAKQNRPCKRMEITVGAGTCSLLGFDDGLYIDVKLNADADIEETGERAQTVIRALSFVLGVHLHPIALLTETPDRQKLQLFSRDAAAERIRVSSPIHWSDDLETPQQLFDLLVGMSPSDLLAFYGRWYRVAHSWGGDIEIQGLVVSVAVEGIVKTCFKHLYPAAPASANVLVAAIPAIEATDLDPAVKKRITGWMSKAIEPSIQNAWHALLESKVVTQELVTKWKFLRNRAAHGTGLWELYEPQVVVDAVYACLELFYRLALNGIGYAGAIQQFSIHGWPRAELALPSPEVSNIDDSESGQEDVG